MTSEEKPKRTKREVFTERLIRSAALTGHLEYAKMYIDEAEHQGGEGYWDNFATLQELMTDFELFIQTLSK